MEAAAPLLAAVAENVGFGAGSSQRRHRQRLAPVAAQDAEREFMADLASGTLPSLRSIRARMHVGQDRARAIREHLESVAVRAEVAL